MHFRKTPLTAVCGKIIGESEGPDRKLSYGQSQERRRLGVGWFLVKMDKRRMKSNDRTWEWVGCRKDVKDCQSR